MDTPQDPLWLKIVGRVLGWAIVIAAVAMGVHVTRINYEYPRTDDAAVTANVVGIAPHVSGALISLNVKDDQMVNTGDPLFTIDPRPYEATVARAKAALMLAQSELEAMSNSISAAESMVKVRDAELSLAQSELRRYLPLLKTEAIDALSVDTARMGQRTAEARLAAAQQDLQQQQNLLAQFGTLNARIAAAEAELQSEQINLDYCRVTSPFPARVANMEISAGEFARQGEAIFALVDTRTWYVIANFRETFVDSIHAGQEVDVYLMAYPDLKFRGKVEGIGWGIQTEDTTPKGGLMLVKPTLNWVRLAQRIPVRIMLEAPDLKQPYRMGMTAVVTVRKDSGPTGARAPGPKTVNTAAPTSAHRWEQVCLDFLRAELAPTTTRWRDALRLTLLCTVATTIILAFQIPFGEFLIIFFFAVCQPDAWASFRKARLRFVGTIIGGALALFVTATCGDKPGLFIFLQAVIFAIGLFLSRTTTVPYVFLLGTMTFVIATPAVMNDPDASISKVIWRVVLTSIGTAIGTMAQLVLWPEHPEKLLLAQLKRRLERAELILDRIASGGAMAEPISPVTAMAGQLDLLKSAEAGSQWLQQRHTEQVKLICDIEMILLAARRLERLVAGNPEEFNNESAAVRLRVIRRQVAEVRRALEERRLPTPYTAPPAAENAASPLQSALADLDRVLEHMPAAMGFLELAHVEWKHGRHVLDPVREPIAAKNIRNPDCRLANTEVVRFALKSSLAATICYVIYQALDWPGISTCVVTAIICAQSSFGAGLRKSLMRILGASLGGIASLEFAAILLPNVEDAGWFIMGMSLLFFLASWLDVGSSRVSYVGMQMGLAMALVLVNQPHGQVELKAAGDRVFGVLLGIIVMGFVDLTIWPNFAGVSLPRKIRETVRALAMLPRHAARQDWDKLSVNSLSAHGQIAGMLALYEESRMEFGSPATANSTEQQRVLTLINGLQEVFLALLVVLRHHRTMHHEALPAPWQEHVVAVDEAIAQSLDALADTPGEPAARAAVQRLEKLLENLPAIPAEADTPDARAKVSEYALVCRELAGALRRAVERHEKN